MAPSGKSYPAPSIPDTPSKAINDMLLAKCDKTFDSPIKYGAATFICFSFTAIVKLYEIVHRELRPSHTKWMAACGVFSSGTILCAIILYYVILACSVLLYGLLYYSCVVLAFVGVGLGVAGAVFFDKDGTTQSPGFEPTQKAAGLQSNKRD